MNKVNTNKVVTKMVKVIEKVIGRSVEVNNNIEEDGTIQVLVGEMTENEVRMIRIAMCDYLDGEIEVENESIWMKNVTNAFAA